MTDESWSKPLRCPICGLEGEAQLSHLYEPSNSYEPRTIVDLCPRGFQARQDEDDSNIVRFFCIADDVSADQ